VPSFLRAHRRAVAAGLVVAALGLLSAHPTWARSLGLDVWNAPALEAELRAGEDMGRRLSEQDEGVRRRIVVKDAIVGELIAGRVTLARATERFAALNAGQPEYMEAIRASFPGETDHEKCARNVIAFARMRVPPDQRDAVEARLEAQLHEMTGALPAE
jgi:hypothetical protein